MQGEPTGLAKFFNVEEEALQQKSVADHMHCVGMVYDVTTGLVEVVTDRA